MYFSRKITYCFIGGLYYSAGYDTIIGRWIIPSNLKVMIYCFWKTTQIIFYLILKYETWRISTEHKFIEILKSYNMQSF